MQIRIFILALALCLTSDFALAAPTPQQKEAFLSAPTCGRALAMDERYVVFGFGSKDGISAQIDVRSTDATRAPLQLETESSVVDLVLDGETLWALTLNGLEEWHLDTAERAAIYKTYDLGGAFEKNQRATGMEKSGANLVISHGTLGFSIFSLELKRLVKQEQFSGEILAGSIKAVDVAVNGQRTFFLIDNLDIEVGQRPRPFRGIVVFDLASGKIERALPGIDAGARTIAIEGKNLFIGFGQSIWKFTLSKVLAEKSKKLKQDNYIWQYGVKGQPVGKPLFDADSMMTCFSKAPDEKRQPYRSVPMIFSRQDLRL